jgi:hypothetical protein
LLKNNPRKNTELKYFNAIEIYLGNLEGLASWA